MEQQTQQNHSAPLQPRLVWFKFPSDTAKFPTKGTPDSAGYDLYADADCLIHPGEQMLVQTNIGVILPRGYYGRIAPRSSLAYKNSIDVFGGVIDADYRQRIGVILFNAGKKDFFVEKGNRIAQLIVERCLHSDEVSVECLSEQDAQKLSSWESQRDGGFGSTGK